MQAIYRVRDTQVKHLRMKPGMQQRVCLEKCLVGGEENMKTNNLSIGGQIMTMFSKNLGCLSLPHLISLQQTDAKQKNQWYPEGRHRKKTGKSYFAVVSSSYFVFRSNSSVLVFSKAKRHKHEALQYWNSSIVINNAVHLLMKKKWSCTPL